jgi:hypothetical protein
MGTPWWLNSSQSHIYYWKMTYFCTVTLCVHLECWKACPPAESYLRGKTTLYFSFDTAYCQLLSSVKDTKSNLRSRLTGAFRVALKATTYTPRTGVRAKSTQQKISHKVHEGSCGATTTAWTASYWYDNFCVNVVPCGENVRHPWFRQKGEAYLHKAKAMISPHEQEGRISC